MTKLKPFKIKYRKGGSGSCRIVSFDPKRLSGCRLEVQLDFIAILLIQLNDANDIQVRLDYELQEKYTALLNLFNEGGKSSKDLIELHYHRAIIDYCSNYVNVSAISDFETIISILEIYYSWQDKHRL
jgi:hypothetical protein